MYSHSIYYRNENNIQIKLHNYDCLHKNKLNCNCEILGAVSTFKYLGMTVDCNFCWHHYVDYDQSCVVKKPEI